MVTLFCLLKQLSMIYTPLNDSTLFWVYQDGLYSQKYLLTPSEQIFFNRLQEYIKDRDYIICPKVRLGDIIGIEKKRWHRVWTFIGRPWTVSGKLDRSHIDFLLIDRKSSLIRYAIELDDSSHASPQARYHDRVKTEACESVELPLLRFQNAHVTHEEFVESWI